MHMTLVFLGGVLKPFDLILLTGSALAVWGCERRQWFADYSPTLLMSATVFPISFAINAAYQRREWVLGLCTDQRAKTYHFLVTITHWYPDRLPSRQNGPPAPSPVRCGFSSLRTSVRLTDSPWDKHVVPCFRRRGTTGATC